MSVEEKFEGFDFSHNQYEQEARQRWGDKAVDSSKSKVEKMSKEEQESLSNAWDEVYKKLAAFRHYSPESENAQEAIKEWYDLLNTFGHYTLDAFKGLGKMYVEDGRFTQNIDKYGEGLAAFMSKAMTVYADNNKR